MYTLDCQGFFGVVRIEMKRDDFSTFLHGVQVVGGSNPLAPTIIKKRGYGDKVVTPFC